MSLRTISAASFCLIGLVSAKSLLARQDSESCPSDSPVSCSSSSVSNTCCTASPGGSLLQTQFWDTDPAIGPSDSWGIHGLWPDTCNGGYQENCDSSRAYTNITDILNAAGQQDLVSYMDTYWQSNDESNEDFWEHEWATHGTCISTLDPSCFSDYQPTEEVPPFFETVVSLFKSLPTYDWLSQAGITPSSDTTYNLSDMENAIENQFGYAPYFDCSDGAVSAIYYYFVVQGPVQSGQFIPAAPSDSSNCPDTVQYLPKN